MSLRLELLGKIEVTSNIWCGKRCEDFGRITVDKDFFQAKVALVHLQIRLKISCSILPVCGCEKN
jgi:hypothetical protein